MLHHITHERHQTGTRGVRHTTHPDAAEALGRKNLDGDDDDGLTSRTATTLAASLLPANQRFIDFHLGSLVGAEKPSFEQGSNPVNGGHGYVGWIIAVGQDEGTRSRPASAQAVLVVRSGGDD